MRLQNHGYLNAKKNMSTICLVMIVRNEADIILECLRSAEKYIDCFVILDSDSTDNTLQLIDEWRAETKMPGSVFNFDEPFRSDHKRTRALQLAKGKADYLLLMDADNLLQEIWKEHNEKYANDETILKFFEKPFADLTDPAYYITQKCDDTTYPVIKLLRGDLDWAFEGIIHEYVVGAGDNPWTGGGPVLPGVIMHEAAKGPGQKRDRDNRTYYYDHALIIERELLDNGKKIPPHLVTRYAFYLAQSYRDCGMVARAIDAYDARSKMTTGYDEEVWYSLYQVARLKQGRGDAPEQVVKAAAACFMARPQRKEGALLLMQLEMAANRFRMAYHVGLSCDSLPCDDKLFIEYDVYENKFPALFEQLQQMF